MRRKKLGSFAAIALAVGTVGFVGSNAKAAPAGAWDMSISDGFSSGSTVFAGTNVSVSGTLTNGDGTSIVYTNFGLKENGSALAYDTKSGASISSFTTTTVSGTIPNSKAGPPVLTKAFNNISAGGYTFAATVANVTNGTTAISETTPDPTPDQITLNVKNHANEIIRGGNFSTYPIGPGDPDYTPRNPSAKDANNVAVASGAQDSTSALNVDFGTVYSDGAHNSYPITYTFSINNSALNAVDLKGTISLASMTTPSYNTTPTWEIINTDTSAVVWTNSNTSQAGTIDVASGGTFHGELLFNTNNPSVYLPKNDFLASWNISLGDDASSIATGGGSANAATNFALNARVTAVPLPAAVWLGSGLLGVGGVFKKFRKNRDTDVI